MFSSVMWLNSIECTFYQMSFDPVQRFLLSPLDSLQPRAEVQIYELFLIKYFPESSSISV